MGSAKGREKHGLGTVAARKVSHGPAWPPTCDGDREVGTLVSSDTLKFAPVRRLGSRQHQAVVGPFLLQDHEVTFFHLLPILVPAHGCVLSVHLAGQHDTL